MAKIVRAPTPHEVKAPYDIVAALKNLDAYAGTHVSEKYQGLASVCAISDTTGPQNPNFTGLAITLYSYSALGFGKSPANDLSSRLGGAK